MYPIPLPAQAMLIHNSSEIPPATFARPGIRGA